MVNLEHNIKFQFVVKKVHLNPETNKQKKLNKSAKIIQLLILKKNVKV
jgi:hypothetical protein